MRVLAKTRDARAVEPLLQEASKRHPSRRSDGLKALGWYGGPEGFDTALTALNSRFAQVTDAAAYALGCIGDRRAVEPLVVALKDANEHVRSSAVLSLQKVGDERAVDGLLEFMRRDAGNAPGYPIDGPSAAEALSVCGPAGVDALLAATRDQDPKVRLCACSGLARDHSPKPPISDERVIRALVGCLLDRDEWVRNRASSALLAYKDRRAAEILLPHLSDPRTDVRRAVIRATWAHGDADVVDKLINVLKHDAEPAVRRDAAWGLGVSHKKEAETPLLEAISQDADADVRDVAQRSLGWVRHDGVPPEELRGFT